jgi:hypothetical protein
MWGSRKMRAAFHGQVLYFSLNGGIGDGRHTEGLADLLERANLLGHETL